MIAQRMSLMVVKKKKEEEKTGIGCTSSELFWIFWGARVYPICHKARWGTPWTAHPSDTQRQKTIHTHTHNTCRQFRLTYQLKPLICKPEYPELTQTPGQHTNAT